MGRLLIPLPCHPDTGPYVPYPTEGQGMRPNRHTRHIVQYRANVAAAHCKFRSVRIGKAQFVQLIVVRRRNHPLSTAVPEKAPLERHPVAPSVGQQWLSH